jgi:hypothetical protein
VAQSIVEITMVNHLDAYAAALPDAADDLAAAMAERWRERAADEAPKVTRSLADSGYVVGSDGRSTYELAAARARQRNPRVGLQPAVSPPPPGQAIVAWAATHAVPVHEGRAKASGGTTVANPFLQRAADALRPDWDAATAAFEASWHALARKAG